MPFDKIKQLLGMKIDPEQQRQLEMYQQDPMLAMKASGQVMDDRIKMAANPELQGPKLGVLNTTPAEEAQASNALMAASTIGSIAPAAESGAAQAIKNLAAANAAKAEAQALPSELSLLDRIKLAASRSKVSGEAADIGKKSMYYKGPK